MEGRPACYSGVDVDSKGMNFVSSAMNGCVETVVSGPSCFSYLCSVQRFDSVLCTVELSANSIQLGDGFITATSPSQHYRGNISVSLRCGLMALMASEWIALYIRWKPK